MLNGIILTKDRRLVMKIINELKGLYKDIQSIRQDLNYIRLAIGRVEGRQLDTLGNDVEYKVFSQWGKMR